MGQWLLNIPIYFIVPTTTTEASTTPRVTRTTSEGEIVTTTTTGQPSTTTPGEVCERVLGMDDPQLVPDRFIEVSPVTQQAFVNYPYVRFFLWCDRHEIWSVSIPRPTDPTDCTVKVVGVELKKS